MQNKYNKTALRWKVYCFSCENEDALNRKQLLEAALTVQKGSLVAFLAACDLSRLRAALTGFWGEVANSHTRPGGMLESCPVPAPNSRLTPSLCARRLETNQMKQKRELRAEKALLHCTRVDKSVWLPQILALVRKTMLFDAGKLQAIATLPAWLHRLI
eukprot:1548202-Amphidinium_carterae.1